MKRLIRKASGYWIRFEEDKVVVSNNVGTKLNIDRDPRTEDNTIIVMFQPGEASTGLIRKTKNGERGFYLELHGEDYAIFDGADQIIADATDESGYQLGKDYTLSYDEILNQFGMSPTKNGDLSKADIEEALDSPNSTNIQEEVNKNRRQL